MVEVMQIVEIVTIAMALATAIARLTPSSEDDTKVEKVRKFLEKVSNIFLPNVKK